MPSLYVYISIFKIIYINVCFVLQAREDSELETRRAVTVVEMIIHSFHERKFLITEYYEQWKVHVTTGKEFKSQWHQFIQDARKVNVLCL